MSFHIWWIAHQPGSAAGRIAPRQPVCPWCPVWDGASSGGDVSERVAGTWGAVRRRRNHRFHRRGLMRIYVGLKLWGKRGHIGREVLVLSMSMSMSVTAKVNGNERNAEVMPASEPSEACGQAFMPSRASAAVGTHPR